MKILVTGGTGLVGRKLLPRLLNEGHTLAILSRNTQKAAETIGLPEFANKPAIAQYFHCDLMTQVPTPNVFAGVEAVIHLAGESIADGRWTPAQKKKIFDSRIVGTQNLVKGFKQPGIAQAPKLFICASAVGIYGDRGDEELTESSQPGSGFLAEVCREWETQANAAGNAQTRVVNFRLGVVLSHDGGALSKMRGPFSYGLGATLGSGKQWLSWVHIDDLVEAFLFVLASPGIKGPINIVAPEPVMNIKFTKVLGASLKKPAFLNIPAFALKLALGEMSETLLGGARVFPVRLNSMGFKFKYPDIAQALKAIR